LKEGMLDWQDAKKSLRK